MATQIFTPAALGANEGYVSKIQLGEKLYYLTDKEVRTFLALLGTAAKKDVAAGVSSSDDGLVTGAQVASAIANLEGAMHFIGISTTDPATAGVTIDGQVYASPEDGDVVMYGVKEFVYGNNKWNELGDEGLYALKSITIGTQNLSTNISLDTLKTDLGLKALAFVDTAKGIVPGQTISGVKATGTSTGSIAVALDHTATEATLTKGDYTPAGTVSTPGIDVTPFTTSIPVVKSVGTAASFTQGSKAAWSASVADEILSFSFTENGDDSFTANTPAELETTNASVLTSVTAALHEAPAFTGTTAENALITKVEYDKAAIDNDNTSFAGAAIELTVGDIAVAAKNVTVSTNPGE